MRRVLAHRPSPARVVACIALVVALGGTGYAAIELPRNSAGAAQLKPDAVTGAKIKDGSLGPGELGAALLDVAVTAGTDIEAATHNVRARYATGAGGFAFHRGNLTDAVTP